MSGWDAYPLASIVLAAFLILIGLLSLLFPFQDKESAGDLKRPWRWERWTGIALVALGLMNLISPNAVTHERPFLILMGSLSLAAALWVLLVRPGLDARRMRRHEARVADRLARGSDAYFEELRALRAYPPLAMTPLRRMLGATILILFGGSYLALGLTK